LKPLSDILLIAVCQCWAELTSSFVLSDDSRGHIDIIRVFGNKPVSNWIWNCD